jgi:hypothetical protein
MSYIACTRFTNDTWDQNIKFREKYEEKVIYGTSVKMRESYEKGCLMFVAEMNNERNKILGIGLIRNSLVDIDKRKIYLNSEYNRYVYRGHYWLSREQLLELEPSIIEIFDNILFKGKSNLKRFLGITVLTKKLFTNWSYEYDDLLKSVKHVFLRTFRTENEGILMQEEEEAELLRL